MPSEAATGPTVLLPIIGTNTTLPPLEVIALNRMAYGPRPGDLERVRQIGLRAYVDEQLNPDVGDDPATAEHLANARLQIAYEAGDDHPALDELRPLRTLNQPLSELWKLNDWDAKISYVERLRPADEVRAATWIRAVHSKWQLREVLVEFWHNHFNVNAYNDDIRIAATWPLYDRDVIRKHALGNFRSFLEAVATSTAMLSYLNNASSKASPANENYARELFELHTLGAPHYFNQIYDKWREVPGALEGKPIGYIDQDVYEAARAFTGWTIADGSDDYVGGTFPNTGEFYYHDGWHDNYQKRVLGIEFDPNQAPLADGRKVLDLVAFHPGTALYICTKLCQRLVADQPPAALVEKAVATWRAHQNAPDQIKQTVQTILLSPEFSNTWGQKVKRPFEVAVAFIRATEATFTPNSTLDYFLDEYGYKLFSWPAPTGHPDMAGYWLSTNVMLGRWNLPLLLTSDWLGAAQFDLIGQQPANASVRQLVDFWVMRMLGRAVPPATTAALIALLAQEGNPEQAPQGDDTDDLRERVHSLVTLIAMTPEFQLR
jgi:uncharacterized protein (DUF1800 family)